MTCPHCHHQLTADELRSLWGAHCSAQRGANAGGRPPALSPAQQDDARRRAAAGESRASIADDLGVNRSTIYRMLAKDHSR